MYVFNPFTGTLDWTAAGGGVETQDEGVTEGTGQTELDFVGAGVSISVAGTKTTVNIPGGGGGGSLDEALAAAVVLG